MLSLKLPEGALCELLHADDCETIEGIMNKHSKWKAFESNGLKVNLGKTKIMVNGSI